MASSRAPLASLSNTLPVTENKRGGGGAAHQSRYARRSRPGSAIPSEATAVGPHSLLGATSSPTAAVKSKGSATAVTVVAPVTSSDMLHPLQKWRVKQAQKHAANVERGQQLSAAYRDRPKRTPQTKSQKSGLIFPVHSILKRLKLSSNAKRVQTTSGVMLAGVLEYLTAEVLELAGNKTMESKCKRIIPRHIFLAVKNDDELDKLLDGATIASGGTIPFIHQVLLKKKTMPLIGVERSKSSNPSSPATPEHGKFKKEKHAASKSTTAEAANTSAHANTHQAVADEEEREEINETAATIARTSRDLDAHADTLLFSTSTPSSKKRKVSIANHAATDANKENDAPPQQSTKRTKK